MIVWVHLDCGCVADFFFVVYVEIKPIILYSTHQAVSRRLSARKLHCSEISRRFDALDSTQQLPHRDQVYCWIFFLRRSSKITDGLQITQIITRQNDVRLHFSLVFCIQLCANKRPKRYSKKENFLSIRLDSSKRIWSMCDDNIF